MENTDKNQPTQNVAVGPYHLGNAGDHIAVPSTEDNSVAIPPTESSDLSEANGY